INECIELGQSPVREIANAVLARRLLDPYRSRVDLGGDLRRDEAIPHHLLDHDARTAACSLDVRAWRIVRRCLDQSGDDRRLAKAQVISSVTEEFPGGGV